MGIPWPPKAFLWVRGRITNPRENVRWCIFRSLRAWKVEFRRQARKKSVTLHPEPRTLIFTSLTPGYLMSMALNYAAAYASVLASAARLSFSPALLVKSIDRKALRLALTPTCSSRTLRNSRTQSISLSPKQKPQNSTP